MSSDRQKLGVEGRSERTSVRTLAGTWRSLTHKVADHEGCNALLQQSLRNKQIPGLLDYTLTDNFRDLEVQFGNLFDSRYAAVEVIGPNGSGKSNFIGVFSFLNAIREGRLHDYVRKVGGAEKLLHFGSKTTD